MSFCSKIKKELCDIKEYDDIAIKAEFYGMMMFSKSFSYKSIQLVNENRFILDLYSDLIIKFVNGIVDIKSFNRGRGKKLFLSSVPYEDDRISIIKTFGYNEDIEKIKIIKSNYENFVDRFLRGAFLACGNITNPNSNYHLEFKIWNLNIADEFVNIISKLKEVKLKPHILKKKEYSILYFRESEQITDFLAFIGAHKSAMEFMQVKILKGIRNNVNRKNNFETANTDKIAFASAQQIRAIKLINLKIGLESLPKDLKEIAVLRIKHPDASLSELNSMLKNKISKSGVNHRLNKIIKISEKLN